MSSCDNAGPGPAYGKPTTVGYEGHDLTLVRHPAFSFGLKTYSKSISFPGPYTIGPCDNHGRYPTPGCKIGIKPNVAGIEQSPGPADFYTPDKPRSGYSMGLKLKMYDKENTPGPAQYYYSPKKGGGWTIGTKQKSTMTVTPGPYASVDLNKIKSRPPAAPIAGRGFTLDASTPGPGPAIQMPKGYHGPAYSFGLKHHKCSPPLITPADNNY